VGVWRRGIEELICKAIECGAGSLVEKVRVDAHPLRHESNRIGVHAVYQLLESRRVWGFWRARHLWNSTKTLVTGGLLKEAFGGILGRVESSLKEGTTLPPVRQ